MLARIAAIAALLPIAANAANTANAATFPPTADYQAPSVKAEALSSTAPWWERLVVTIGEEGDTETCLFQSSLDPGASLDCSVGNEDANAGVKAVASSGVPEQMTHITFERRFSPSASLSDGEVAAGDTLLGKSVLALAIDKDGRVRGCKVVAIAGTAKPDYSCKEATAEKFEASASGAAKPLRVATLTILVYAHDEDYV